MPTDSNELAALAVAALEELKASNVVQLDVRGNTPVIRPDGQRTTAADWAEELGLFYSPSILFFDESGREILRVDSVAHFFRLRNVLNYVANRGYLYEPSYRRWRSKYGF